MSSSKSSSPSMKKVIVFGATGAVGSHLISILSEEEPDWEIYAVTRSSNCANFSNLPNVKILQGDPNEQDQVLKLTANKDIVYACIGFPQYERKYWAKHWPVVVDNLLAGSSQFTSQKFVFCDNLYAYGPNKNISPTKTPTLKPSTKSKPAIRAMLREKFQTRMDQHPESITVVGAADFFGPLVTNASFLGDTFTKAIVEGEKSPLAVGSSRAIHDFCYVPDFSKALYVASISEKANGKFWIAPHSVQNKTMEDIAKDIARLCHSKKQTPNIQVLPGWAVRLLSPFVPFLGEVVEMLPFWQKDYSVDDSEFCQTFGIAATPCDEALASYIDFYRHEVLASSQA